MATNYTPGRTNFGLLPEPERSAGSFVASMFVNATIVGLAVVVGATAKKAIEAHRYEETVLIVPSQPPPPPPPKVKIPEPPKVVDQPKLPEVKLDRPKIAVPKPEPEELKPIQMEAKVDAPQFKVIKPTVKEAPQPKAAITAAMPAQSPTVKPSTAPVHLGDTFGVTPNPNATRPATIAAIGNPYGGQQGPSVAPHGVVGSTGIGNGPKSGSGGQAGAYAGVKVASAGIPNQEAVKPVQQQQTAAAATTPIEVISKPAVQYTAEARQLRIEGDVVLRVTFTAGGQVIVQNVVQGLGHGLDEEARRVAQQIRYHPAMRNGQAVDSTTIIRITFQLA